jgi:hypothetical protein
MQHLSGFVNGLCSSQTNVSQTNYSEFDWHKDTQEVEEDFERWPSFSLPESVGARRENEGIPCGNGECTNKEVFLSGQVGWKV